MPRARSRERRLSRNAGGCTYSLPRVEHSRRRGPIRSVGAARNKENGVLRRDAERARQISLSLPVDRPPPHLHPTPPPSIPRSRETGNFQFPDIYRPWTASCVTRDTTTLLPLEPTGSRFFSPGNSSISFITLRSRLRNAKRERHLRVTSLLPSPFVSPRDRTRVSAVFFLARRSRFNASCDMASRQIRLKLEIYTNRNSEFLIFYLKEGKDIQKCIYIYIYMRILLFVHITVYDFLPTVYARTRLNGLLLASAMKPRVYIDYRRAKNCRGLLPNSLSFSLKFQMCVDN